MAARWWSASWSSATRSATATRSTGCRSRSAAARSSVCWGRTARARRPRWGPDDPGEGHLRRRLGRRRRRAAQLGRGQAAAGRGAAAGQPGPVAHRPPEPGLPRGLPPGAERRAARQGGPGAGGARARRPRQRQGRRVLRRHGAAADDRQGTDARAGGAVPRRADHRPGPAGPAVRLGPGPELRGRGVTILLTTHDMDEAAELADRVGIMDHGKLLALDTPAALTRGLTGQAVLDVTVTPAAADTVERLLEALTALAGVERGEPVARQQPAFAAAGPGGWPGRLGAGPGGNGGRPGNGPGGPRPGAHQDGGEVRLRLYLSGEPAVLLGPVVEALASRGAALR